MRLLFALLLMSPIFAAPAIQPGSDQLQLILEDDPEAPSSLGHDIAVDGIRIAVSRHGKVNILRNEHNEWILEGQITIPWGEGSARNDLSVDLSGDLCIIGAQYAGHEGAATGVAIVYRRVDDDWSREAILAPGKKFHGMRFGSDVAVDGNTCVIGARGTNEFAGSAHVFQHRDGAWIEEAQLNGERIRMFGSYVAIRNGRCLIGGSANDWGGERAYIFSRAANGEWALESELAPIRKYRPHLGEFPVALTDNLAIVAGYKDEQGNPFVATWTRTNGKWNESGVIRPTSGKGYVFGFSVAAAGDSVVVSDAGTGVSVYKRRADSDNWRAIQNIAAPPRTAHFGWSVSLSDRWVAIGAPLKRPATDSSAKSGAFAQELEEEGEQCPPTRGDVPR